VAQKNRNFSLGFKKRRLFYTFLSPVAAQKQFGQFGGVLFGGVLIVLEVIRIYRGLVEEDATRSESQFAFYLDEPALVTLGVLLTQTMQKRADKMMPCHAAAGTGG
jgi:hypothetical protein